MAEEKTMSLSDMYQEEFENFDFEAAQDEMENENRMIYDKLELSLEIVQEKILKGDTDLIEVRNILNDALEYVDMNFRAINPDYFWLKDYKIIPTIEIINFLNVDH